MQAPKGDAPRNQIYWSCARTILPAPQPHTSSYGTDICWQSTLTNNQLRSAAGVYGRTFTWTPQPLSISSVREAERFSFCVMLFTFCFNWTLYFIYLIDSNCLSLFISVFVGFVATLCSSFFFRCQNSKSWKSCRARSRGASQPRSAPIRVFLKREHCWNLVDISSLTEFYHKFDEISMNFMCSAACIQIWSF